MCIRRYIRSKQHNIFFFSPSTLHFGLRHLCLAFERNNIRLWLEQQTSPIHTHVISCSYNTNSIPCYLCDGWMVAAAAAAAAATVAAITANWRDFSAYTTHIITKWMRVRIYAIQWKTLSQKAHRHQIDQHNKREHFLFCATIVRLYGKKTFCFSAFFLCMRNI